MLELGRPLHVYDLDKLRGAIDVRWGRKGEKVLLLNEQEVEVDDTVLCITDDSGVIGLGGIMGGESTKADESTQNVFLESAFFWPDAIAGPRAALQLLERRLAPLRARRRLRQQRRRHRARHAADPRHLRRRARADGRHRGAAAEAQAGDDARGARAEGDRRAGAGEGDGGGVFKRLGFEFKPKQDAFTVKPPSYRFDIAIEEDLIEEVARLYGFERIAAHPPRVAATHAAGARRRRRSLHALRERLAASDYREVINFSFVEPGWEADFAGEANPIRLLNPIASQQSVMRTIADRLSGRKHRIQPRAQSPAHPRVRSRAACSCATPAAKDGPLSVGGLRQPMRIAAAAYGPR